MNSWPKTIFEPTPVGRCRSAFAVDITCPAWLSSRSSGSMNNPPGIIWGAA